MGHQADFSEQSMLFVTLDCYEYCLNASTVDSEIFSGSQCIRMYATETQLYQLRLGEIACMVQQF